MARRQLGALLTLCGMLTVVFGPQTLVGQAYDVPRTEWGQPDLQGNWTNATLTPLERVEGHGPVYTQAQVDSLYRASGESIDVKFDPSDPGVGRLDLLLEGGGLRPEEVYWERDHQVARVDGEPRSSLIQFPGNGRIAEMTPQGEQRLQEYHDFRSQFGESDHPELRTLADRCLIFNSNGGPPMLPRNVHNDNYTIVQNRDHVVILMEMMHDARIIRLGERD